MARTLLALAAGLLFAAALPSAHSSAQTKPVEITNAWARATPGKAENGAAYLTLQSAAGDRLTGASAPVAKKAEMHSMTMQGTVMKMRQIAAIELPAGKPVTLKPGHLHIMLLGLTKPLQVGQTFPLTLHFAKAGTQVVDVKVEKVGAMGPQKTSGGHMSMPKPAHH